MDGTFSKNGTHCHDKNTRKIYGWFSGCCRGVVTNCEQTSDKTTRTSREVENVEWCLPVRLHSPEPLHSYATDPDTRHHKFDIFAVLHPTRNPTLLPDIRIHQFDTYNNRQQPSVRLRHIFFYRLISPKPVGASSLIVSFHFSPYRHNKPYWLWLLRYNTLRQYLAP